MRRAKARVNPSEPSLPFRLSPGIEAIGFLWAALTALGAFRLTPAAGVQVIPWVQIAAQAVLLALACLAVGIYAHRAQVLPRLVGFTGSAIFFTVLLAQIVHPWVPYLAPAPLAAALVTLFVGLPMGIATNLLVAFVIELLGPPLAGLIAFAGGLVAIFCVTRLSKLSDLALGGFEIALVNALVYGSGTAIWGGFRPDSLLWTTLSGPLTALLIMGLLPLTEQITQKTSPLGLMELLNPSHPLLELLRERAPGTYHHSFTVADLSEAAAEAIGADPLLAKVGGYYHDIGKIARPEFFLENQQGGTNPHDTLAPSLSKTVITAHIREGIELGRRFGLKEDVLQFIPQHHGTSVIRYFYVKALREGQEECSIDDFRYDAELPKTKETAIVMLADGIEASSRSIENGSRLETLVEEAIREKIEDGQLREAPLTLAELERIKKAFVVTLHAMKHGRPVHIPKIVK
ncbi:MAG: HDIG domain-containing protein [Candidatus Bipolaricaulota bacterium]|nr:HDIG domain-containing protein [Candidatus Bipolaricaulota bacterium]